MFSQRFKIFIQVPLLSSIFTWHTIIDDDRRNYDLPQLTHIQGHEIKDDIKLHKKSFNLRIFYEQLKEVLE